MNNDVSEGTIRGGFPRSCASPVGPRVVSSEASVGWRAPKCMSGNRYHFYNGGTHCLCGRWKVTELMREAEQRRVIVHMDAKDCAAKWREIHEPNWPAYQHGGRK